MIVAVLDTNVLASGFDGYGRSDSIPGELLRRWRGAIFTLIVSEPILNELTRALSNPYFSRRLSAAEIEDAFLRLQAQARIQSLTVSVSGVASHRAEDLILATALSARADYLVTGDRQLREWG